MRDGVFSDRDAGCPVIVFRLRPVRGLGFRKKGDRLQPDDLAGTSDEPRRRGSRCEYLFNGPRTTSPRR